MCAQTSDRWRYKPMGIVPPSCLLSERRRYPFIKASYHTHSNPPWREKPLSFLFSTRRTSILHCDILIESGAYSLVRPMQGLGGEKYVCSIDRKRETDQAGDDLQVRTFRVSTPATESMPETTSSSVTPIATTKDRRCAIAAPILLYSHSHVAFSLSPVSPARGRCRKISSAFTRP